jgi:hypothetical protein
MRTAIILLAAALASGCDKPPAPVRYDLSFAFSVPDGTEVVIDGKTVGTFDKQHAAVQLSEGATLSGAGSLAVRFPTVCGHAERPFTLTGDELSGRKDSPTGKTIRVALAMKMKDVPVRTTVWVDPEAKGDVVVGKTTLAKGGNRIFVVDCDDEGRTITVGGKARAPLPAYDPKSLDQLFIPATVDTCFELVSHVYGKSGAMPNLTKSTPLPGKPFHALPLINFFLQEPPATVEVLEETETKLELKRVACSAPDSEPAP